MLPAIILSMLGTIAFRWISYLCGANDLFYVLLPGSMGSLAAGALIAYVMRYDPKNTLLMTFSRWRPYLLLVCLPIIGAAIYFNNIVLWNAAFLFEPLMAACLVTLAIEGQRDWRTDWLANPIATYIGKISYGIYVYHYFVPDLIDSYIPNLHSYTATVCSHSSRAVS